MKLELKKGHDHLKLALPDDRIIGVIEGKDIPALPLSDAKGIISSGIRLHAPAKLSGKKIVIIVPDNTRLWARGDLFVPEIINTLVENGATSENVTILIALGTHQDLPLETFPSLVGSAVAKKYQVINSANKNQERLVEIGTTSRGTRVTISREACEADHIIIFGGLLHHLIAGFGGGRKYILPGIAGYKSIQQNHALAFLPDGSPHSKVQQGILEGNPIHEDMQEAAEMFLAGKTSTFVGVAVNGKGEIFYANAGELEEIFQEGCQEVNRACCVSINELADFALISAGGYRTDGQLYQATKALFNAVHAVKPGGKILFVAEAAEGIGNTEFGEVLSQYKNQPEKIGKVLNKTFSMPAYVAYRVADLLNRFEVTLVSNFSKTETENYGFMYVDNPAGFVNSLTGKGFAIPYAENILPIVKGLK
ncbi:MAG: nickel-dependent lactate racemase [Proteobacteria bacterium]|nr:nickel-dependent lactate racemase [Pseudomonadota bacterium]